MSYRDEVLADGPALYWPLDSTSGATDQSGNGRNGTGLGGVTIGGDASFPGAQTGGSTDFDGIDDRVTSTYAPFVNAAGQTFEGCAFRDVNTANHALIGGIGGAANGPLVRLNSGNNDVIWQTVAGTGGITWAAAWPGVTQWVHWALAFNEAGDTAELFINGASISSQADAEAYGTPGNYEVGETSGGLQRFDGKQAHLAVYPSLLSAARIQAHFDALDDVIVPPLTILPCFSPSRIGPF